MPSLRVAHVTYAMNCGGVEHFIIRQSEFLKSHGCDIEIITTESKGEWFDQLAEKKLKSTNIPKSGYAMQYQHAIKVGRYLVSRNFDVIFLNHAAHAQVVLGMLPHNTIVIPILHSDSESCYRVGLANNSSWHIAVGVSPKLCSIAKNRVPGKPIRYIPHGVTSSCP